MQFLCIHSFIHCHAAKSILHISHLNQFVRLVSDVPPHNHILTQDRKSLTAHTTSSCRFSLIGQLHFEGAAIHTVSCRRWSLSEIKLLSTMYCIVMKCVRVSVSVCVYVCISSRIHTLCPHCCPQAQRDAGHVELTWLHTDAGSRKTRETKLPWYKINLLARDNCETCWFICCRYHNLFFPSPLPPLSSFSY